MSKPYDPLAEREEERRRAELLALEALRCAGLLGPVTDEHVAELERCVQQDKEPLPSALFAPLDLRKPFERRRMQVQQPLLDASTQQNMARAAREGRTISPEIEARIQQDREAAKRNGHGKGK